LPVKKVRVEQPAALPAAVKELDLYPPLPTLVVSGGAAEVEAREFAQLGPIVEELTAVAERLGAAVVDGGTDEGVMRLLGEARARAGSFPLIGVAVESLAVDPDATRHGEQALLEPNHTHVILVPGKQWGDEVPWLADVAQLLARDRPSVTVVINGGEIAYADAAASISAGRPVLAVEGTGRTADALAAASRGTETDPRARALAASGLVQAVDVRENHLVELEQILTRRN
jgi:SLOG in TRPM, prokaryote